MAKRHAEELQSKCPDTANFARCHTAGSHGTEREAVREGILRYSHLGEGFGYLVTIIRLNAQTPVAHSTV